MEDYFKLITNYYKPSEPINDINLFVGRDNEKTYLYKALSTPGRNPVIYGVRGIGKTSLLNITCGYFSRQNDYAVFRHSCCNVDDYASIFKAFMQLVSTEISQNLANNIRNFVGGKTIGILDSSTGSESINLAECEITPTSISRFFSKIKCILIIDELDQLRDDKKSIKLIADSIKSLSDTNSLTKIVLSGVSNSLIELVGNHQSVMRNLVSIEVPRMTDIELANIISNGTSKLNINFSNDLVESILWLSDGLPYFTHLISECLADYLLYSSKTSATKVDLYPVLKNVIQNMALREIVEQNYTDTWSSHKQKLFLNIDRIVNQDADRYSPQAKRTVLNILSKLESTDSNILEKIHNEYLEFRNEKNKTLMMVDRFDIENILDIMSKRTDMIFQFNGQYFFKDSFHKVFARIKSLEDI